MTDDRLISEPTEVVSSAIFSELYGALARDRGLGVGGPGVTLEDIVRESLKPLLREWLDANLPDLVERLVRKEIERLVTGADTR
jgi:cell pole-organizing protein PopZ